MGLQKQLLLEVATTILISLIMWPLVSLVLAWPFSLLWNWLFPNIFGLPTLTFWQSVGLMLLVSLLFRWRVSFDRSGHSVGVEKNDLP